MSHRDHASNAAQTATAAAAHANPFSDALAGPLPRLTDRGLFDKSPLISPVVFCGLVRLAESALLATLGFLIAAIYVSDADLSQSSQYVFVPVATALLCTAAAQGLGLYTIPAFSTFQRQLPRLALAWFAAVAALVAIMFFLKSGPEFSRVWLAVWLVAGLLGLVAVRAYVARLTHQGIQQGRLVRRAVIYGGGPVCERLLAALDADPASDIRICGVFDDRNVERSGRHVVGYPRLGTSEALINFSRNARVDMLIVALPMVAENRLVGLVRKLGVLPVDMRLAGAATGLTLARRTYSHIGSVPLLDIADKPIDDWGSIAKWAFDKVVATLALVALSPLMAVIAALIKLDSRGPVLFRQKRYGFNNELIEVFKFRSMYTDLSDAGAARLVTKADPRVTRIGRFIRKASIDELPQLFNVLAGHLSLVGPRPHAVQAKAADKLYPDVVDNYFARHKVKPGITGWAQINGWRGETDTPEKIEKRVEHDLFYIDNWSLLFDAYILVKTPFALFKSENAY